MSAIMNKSESASSRWARIIEEQRASGLSIAEFCRRRNISPPSFFGWRRRLIAACDAEIPAFVEVKVGQPGPHRQAAEATPLELVVPNGLRVLVRPGFDRQTLRDLVAALEASA
ncbi:MAG: transposase [Planctomycetota bacterium]|nr:transposase [Planctomycetota bacterium]